MEHMGMQDYGQAEDEATSQSMASMAMESGPIRQKSVGSARGSGMQIKQASMQDSSGGAAAPKQPISDSAVNSDGRVLIRTGSMSLVVDKVDAALEAIRTEAVRLKGYVGHTSSGTSGHPSLPNQDAIDRSASHGYISVRVPPAQFEELRAYVRTLAKWIKSDGADTKDVSDEYFDAEARVKTLTTAHSRLNALMDKATDSNAVATLFRESNNMELQLSSLKGRLRRMGDQAQLSTLNVNVELEPKAPTWVPPTYWSAWNTASRAFNSLGRALERLVDSIIWTFVLVLPLAAFGALCLWAVIKCITTWGLLDWLFRGQRAGPEE
jgi:hypothetical protein